jgi:hypothetical protein
VLNYNQVIPKPFCAANVPYVYVSGPVTLSQTDGLGQGGEYWMEFTAEGTLSVTPIDLATGQPDFSRTYSASIQQKHRARFWNDHFSIAADKLQMEIPPSGPDRGRFTSSLRLGSQGQTAFRAQEVCLP